MIKNMGKYKKFLDRQVFKHYVSLGGSCHVAASMAKLGIRNFSGPFDWYISPLRGVLQCLDMDFDGGIWSGLPDWIRIVRPCWTAQGQVR